MRIDPLFVLQRFPHNPGASIRTMTSAFEKLGFGYICADTLYEPIKESVGQSQSNRAH
jgi:hypothetical protein